MNNQQQKIVVLNQKSMGVSFLLTFFFGPLGMFYSTVLGGVVMLVVSVFVFIVTIGLGTLLTWPICIIWAAIATSSHNKRAINSINNY